MLLKNNFFYCSVIILILFSVSKLYSASPIDTAKTKKVIGLPKFTPSLDTSKSTLLSDTTNTRNDADKDTLGPWGLKKPGEGFNIFENKIASMNITAYGLFRYVNQLPPTQKDYVDHTGKLRTIDKRNDFQWHRVLITLKGFLYDKKFIYACRLWLLNATNHINIIGYGMYNFCKQFHLWGGVGSLPGIYTLHYSHPFWLGTDRIMAEEFFRPGFTTGIWVDGEVLPGLNYHAMVGNSLSQVGIKASQLSRDLAKSVSIWWQPTTHEFGPFAGFSDYEVHQKVATTIGGSYTQSREDRYSQTTNFPDNTQTRLSDATLPFETGAFAPGLTVNQMDYQMVSGNVGVKFKGFFLITEFYYRLLNNFDADGPMPIDKVIDRGFMVQTSYFVIKKRLELYAATSQIYGEFNKSDEYIAGFNVYPFSTRMLRMNLHTIFVNRAAASSYFGYYVGGLRGTIVSFSTTVYF